MVVVLVFVERSTWLVKFIIEGFKYLGQVPIQKASIVGYFRDLLAENGTKPEKECR